MKLHVSTTRLSELIALWEHGPEVARAEMHAAIDECTMLVEREVKENTPTGATETLVNSIFSNTEVASDSVIGMVATSAVHALPVELGTKPHSISIAGQQAIRDWVIKKLGIAADEVDAVTNAVIWKIRRYGTKGAHMFERAFNSTRPQVEQRLDLGVVRIINQLIPQ
jgi:hypothetical protein